MKYIGFYVVGSFALIGFMYCYKGVVKCLK